jgi:hypothetical protein
MAEVRLIEVVLLSLRFRMWPDPPAPAAAHSSTPFAYSEGDFLTLAAATERDDNGLVLYLQAEIDDRAIPFTLSLLLGGRFELADDEPEDVEALVSLCYPFLRETVANVTGQSPAPPYYLPRYRLTSSGPPVGGRRSRSAGPA